MLARTGDLRDDGERAYELKFHGSGRPALRDAVLRQVFVDGVALTGPTGGDF